MLAPSGSAVTLDNLVFPAGVLQATTNNDLLQDTNPAVFGSITLSGAGYTLQGNAIVLGSSTVAGSG